MSCCGAVRRARQYGLVRRLPRSASLSGRERLRREAHTVGVIVVGVGATDSGWIAAELVDGRLAEIRVFPDIQSVFVEYGERAAAIAIDMPIGLSEEGERSADKAARAFVGARASSVFAPPPRWVADLPD